MIYIAVDPGGYSGVARWDSESDDVPLTFEVTANRTGFCVKELLEGESGALARVHVTCEKYTIKQSGVMTNQPDALMISGVVEFLCDWYGVPLTWQTPGDAKSLVSDKTLRDLGWYVRTKDGHANDAMRHILRLVATKEPVRYAELVGL